MRCRVLTVKLKNLDSGINAGKEYALGVKAQA